MELGEREPAAKMLFGEFWHRGELCILFADTNIGKSVLAVQIANSIALGKAIAPFALRTKPAKVLYIDFELTAKQFYKRYKDGKGAYNFTDNLNLSILVLTHTPKRRNPGSSISADDLHGSKLLINFPLASGI